MSKKTDEITCPTCNKPKTWTSDNTARPFCSDRCKLIDLGDWADEKHSVPGDPAFPPDNDPENET